MNELENNYLEHHGVLGQKWHKRNGPPYPLGASDHSKSEQNAGWRKSLGTGRNEDLYDRHGNLKRGKVQRQLNTHDQGRVEDEYKAQKHLTKSIKAGQKYDKVAKKYANKINKINKKQQKELEKANSVRDDHFNNIVITSGKSRELEEKANKLFQKGTEKMTKIGAKAQKELSIASEYTDYAMQHRAATESILKEVANSGEFKVDSKETKRLANRGEVQVAQYLGGLGAAFAVAKYEKGTIYKVKKKQSSDITVDDIEREALRMNGGKPYNNVHEYADAYKQAAQNLKEGRTNKSKTNTTEEEALKNDLKFREYVKSLQSDIQENKKKVPKDVQDYIDNNKGYDLEAKSDEYKRYLKDPEKWRASKDRYKK